MSIVIHATRPISVAVSRVVPPRDGGILGADVIKTILEFAVNYRKYKDLELKIDPPRGVADETHQYYDYYNAFRVFSRDFIPFAGFSEFLEHDFVPRTIQLDASKNLNHKWTMNANLIIDFFALLVAIYAHPKRGSAYKNKGLHKFLTDIFMKPPPNMENHRINTYNDYTFDMFLTDLNERCGANCVGHLRKPQQNRVMLHVYAFFCYIIKLEDENGNRSENESQSNIYQPDFSVNDPFPSSVDEELPDIGTLPGLDEVLQWLGGPEPIDPEYDNSIG